MEKRSKTSGKQKLHKFNSETRLITCRVISCKQELLAKNYRQHLADRHPEENLQDLSPFGQTKLSFARPTSARPQPDQLQTHAKRHCAELTDEPKKKFPKNVDDVTSDIDFFFLFAVEHEQAPSKLSDFSSSFKDNNSERILGNEHHESSLSSDSEKLCTIIKNVNIVKEDVAKLNEEIET